MSLFNYRSLSFAAMLLLAGSSAMAQKDGHALSSNDSMLTRAMKNYVPRTYALPWVQLAEKDISWRRRVWQDIDVTAKGNKPFNNDSRNSLMSVLTDGALSGKIKAYDATNDRFTKALGQKDIKELVGTAGTASKVSKVEIKEDWLHMTKDNKIEVRIVGLAMMKEVKGADGKIKDQPLFWVYYPDCRNYLAEHKVPKTKDMNWDQLFESRKFNGEIVKVSNMTKPIGYKK